VTGCAAWRLAHWFHRDSSRLVADLRQGPCAVIALFTTRSAVHVTLGTPVQLRVCWTGANTPNTVRRLFWGFMQRRCQLPVRCGQCFKQSGSCGLMPCKLPGIQQGLRVWSALGRTPVSLSCSVLFSNWYALLWRCCVGKPCCHWVVHLPNGRCSAHVAWSQAHILKKSRDRTHTWMCDLRSPATMFLDTIVVFWALDLEQGSCAGCQQLPASPTNRPGLDSVLGSWYYVIVSSYCSTVYCRRLALHMHQGLLHLTALMLTQNVLPCWLHQGLRCWV
jgi:hypothetical protein